MNFLHLLRTQYGYCNAADTETATAGDQTTETTNQENSSTSTSGENTQTGTQGNQQTNTITKTVEDKSVTTDFPEDWRDKLAGDDPKFRKQLERYASPGALAKAHRELQAKVSSGELRGSNKLPEKPTDEELSAWRKENGVPDKPADYINDLPSGIVLGEDDKPRVDSFIKQMHELNAPKGLVQSAIEWNQKQIEEDMQQRYERNANLQDSTEEELRAEWGGEYKRNINLVSGLIATLPESARDVFTGALSPDGTAIFNNPEVVRWMVDMARKVNPVGTVVPGATNISAVDNEIETIEKTMRDNRAAYNKDTKMQERYLQLLEAKERFTS